MKSRLFSRKILFLREKKDLATATMVFLRNFPRPCSEGLILPSED